MLMTCWSVIIMAFICSWVNVLWRQCATILLKELLRILNSLRSDTSSMLTLKEWCCINPLVFLWCHIIYHIVECILKYLFVWSFLFMGFLKDTLQLPFMLCLMCFFIQCLFLYLSLSALWFWFFTNNFFLFYFCTGRKGFVEIKTIPNC